MTTIIVTVLITWAIIGGIWGFFDVWNPDVDRGVLIVLGGPLAWLMFLGILIGAAWVRCVKRPLGVNLYWAIDLRKDWAALPKTYTLYGFSTRWGFVGFMRLRNTTREGGKV